MQQSIQRTLEPSAAVPVVLLPPAVHQAVAAERRAVRNRRWGRAAVWCFRALLIIPFVLMAPEVLALVRDEPNAAANVSASTADVLGTSSFLLFTMMLCVTPVHTLTGWRWHLILRRDYGVAMFCTAATDLTLAAITTGDTFPGTVLSRTVGHSFLLFGSLSVVLLIPLTLTANRRAMRWLGRHWKTVQRFTYLVWLTILVHLAFLFGLSSFFLCALAISAPLALLRVPAVRRWWRRARGEHRHRLVRSIAFALMASTFLAGYVPLVHELVIKGGAAFVQRPPND